LKVDRPATLAPEKRSENPLFYSGLYPGRVIHISFAGKKLDVPTKLSDTNRAKKTYPHACFVSVFYRFPIIRAANQQQN
jgi:hypothetical protein